jgi:hypothetical protein
MPTPAEHPLTTAARDWYDAGYCVVPSHEDGGKRPFGPWKTYQGSRPDWQDVQGWLATDRFTGIGAIMGTASGDSELIEIEGPDEATGEAIARLTSKAREMGCFDLLNRALQGCIIRSAGDGLHLFIRITDGVAKANTKLAMSPDGKVIAETRGEGGFVIVAPTPGRSGHRDGAVYAFIGPSNPSRTAEVTAAERDMLHELFTAALDQSPAVPEPVKAPTTSTTPYEGTSALDAYRATSWADILTPAGWTYCHRDDTRDYWVRPGKGLSEGISASTIEDGPLVNFSTSVPWPTDVGLSKGQVYALIHHGGDVSAAARELSASGYGDGYTVEPLPAWEANLPPGITDEEALEAAKSSWVREHLPILDWDALWADETEEEWIVEPLLAKRRLVALYSAPKVGKSLLMLELAASMSCGREVLGHPTTPIRTLYVDFENDPRGDVRERLQGMGFAPKDLGNLCYLSFPNISKLDTAAGADQLMAAVHEYRCEVVVVDTVSRSVAGDENENDTWLNFYRHTGLRLKQQEVALIRLDHSGKDETKGQRGGSAKSGDVDAVWRLSKISESSFRLTCEANRFPVGEKVLDMERLEAPYLHHRVDMDARRKALDDICEKFARAGVPRTTKVDKDGERVPETGARAAARMLREAGISFTKAQVTTYTLTEYCRRMPAFHTPEMVS